ncbi:bacteriocin resistance YdeI/OmpD-like protein [Pseudomonas sp. SJZ079]|uniref:YdeI/OmpD-associated family protein n=1 Tax=Pseudomonas sp. SJZ079 TaxID=2572887 RepID=UPI00119C69FF|nr:YdeI/OmpD-associated family protein [Pseudomonas sp. SJZ079]TWC31696.1 bacteriocin resistance YdeI/OmpD-like protein [Pseudomonas sp. SJZ079]
MTQVDRTSQFQAKLLSPLHPGGESSWAFVVLPKDVSEKLPRRGRTTVDGKINGHRFKATLEPDGQLSHWLKVSKELKDAAGAVVGDVVTLEIEAVEQEPEPEMPSDLAEALAAAPEARSVWGETTTIARLDWIHWITSAKQSKTRAKRISDACAMLSSGKRRICCFDPSGYYSKAFRAPEAAD